MSRQLQPGDYVVYRQKLGRVIRRIWRDGQFCCEIDTRCGRRAVVPESELVKVTTAVRAIQGK